jgi:tetratricopeptide (TPR) repeat protein
MMDPQGNNSKTFPVLTRVEALPYKELSPDEFERLIMALVGADPEIEYCRQYGPGRGYEQQGIDLIAKRKDTGDYIAYQCKNRKDMYPKEIEQAIAKFKNGEWINKVSTFVLCTRDNLVSPGQTKKILELERYLGKEKRVKLVTWDGHYLNRELRPRVSIVAEFFPDWLSAFCPAVLDLGDVKLVSPETLQHLPGGNLYYTPPDLGSAISEFRTDIEKLGELRTAVKEAVSDALTDAKELADLGEYRSAEKELSPLKRLIGNLPADEEARYFNILCSIKIAQEKPEEALDFINRALDNEDCVKYKLNKIICLMLIKNGDNQNTAWRLIGEIPENEINTPEYYYVSGLLYFEAEDYFRSVEANEKALELDPAHNESRVNLTAGLLKLGEFDRCDKEFNELRRITCEGGVPRDLHFYTHYGRGFRQLVEITSDRSLFTKESVKETRLLDTITTETLDFPPRTKEMADIALNEFREARKYARGTQQHQVSLNEQFCYFLKGEYGEAKRTLLTIPAEQIPGYFRKAVWYKLSNLYVILGEFENAKNICDRLVEEYEDPKEELPDDIKFIWARALAGFGYKDIRIRQMERHRIELSIGLLLQLISNNPQDLSYKNHLGIIYSYRGYKEKAEAVFLEIAVSHADDKMGLYNLGNHYARNGEYAKAFISYRRLQRKIGSDPDLTSVIPLALGYAGLITGPKRAKRKYIAISVLTEYDRIEPSYTRKREHLRVLIDLYKQSAEIENTPRVRNEYYNDAISIIKKLLQNVSLPDAIIKSLEKEKRFLGFRQKSFA